MSLVINEAVVSSSLRLKSSYDA